MARQDVIPDADVDQDSPVDTDLMEGLRAGYEYDRAHSMRTGTDSLAETTSRLAFAMGRIAFTESATTNPVATGSVSFFTSSLGGDPNFDSSSTPLVMVSMEEDESGVYPPWDDPATGPNSFWCFTKNITYQGFDWEVRTLEGGAMHLAGVLHWVAICPPTSGE